MRDPVICIGRQYGSAGREIGEKVAAWLGIPCYDKFLVKKAAEESGLSLAALTKADETPSASLWFLSGNPIADTAGIASAFYSDSQIAYDAERRVIEQLAGQGPCVIIGRGASDILRRKNNCFSVFLYADKEARLRRVMDRNKIGAQEAERRIRQVDKLRRRYFDSYASTPWGQPDSYDLMIASDRYGVEGCADLILSSIGLLKEGTVSHE